ncbi:MAG: DUF5675 family protein [Dyadobacter sp.]|uniref:DUF5675 family protein n=1 Tax=Dyadobacter sp. TaxID=1914288 RepID=UPI003263C75F
MEILVTRWGKGENSTLSSVTVDGVHQCYFLEDRDRGLTGSMTLAKIQALKVKAATAIPTGRYQVTIALSPRFKKLLPRLLNVPGFAGILIHTGNSDKDTEGCLITGKAYENVGSDYRIKGGTSKPAFEDLFKKIQDSIKTEQKVFITITSQYSETLN